MASTSPIASLTSNIDTNAIVEQLMTVERQPLQKMQQLEVDYQAKISAYATLLSGISGLRGAASDLSGSDVVGMKATVSDSSFMSVTADNSASAGSFKINVGNIASAQSLYSASFSAETDEVADLSGSSTQKISIQVGTSSATEITINSSNNTLSGLKDAINDSGAGVSASIINTGSSVRLVLTATESGADNKITIMADEDNDGNYAEAAETDTTGLSTLAFDATYDASGNVTGGTANMTQSSAAVDANLKINGLSVTRSSNTIDDLITGVTITLQKGDNYASDLTLSVGEDSSSIKTKLTSFITAYNQIMGAIRTFKGSTDSKGVLGSDAVSMGLKDDLNNITVTAYNNTYLSVIGITHDKTGALQLDETALEKALGSDPSGTVATINSMADTLDAQLKTYVDVIIPTRQDGYQSKINATKTKELEFQRKLDLTEIALKNKYIALDNILSQLQGTSNYLTQLTDMMSKKS